MSAGAWGSMGVGGAEAASAAERSLPALPLGVAMLC